MNKNHPFRKLIADGQVTDAQMNEFEEFVSEILRDSPRDDGKAAAIAKHMYTENLLDPEITFSCAMRSALVLLYAIAETVNLPHTFIGSLVSMYMGQNNPSDPIINTIQKPSLPN